MELYVLTTFGNNFEPTKLTQRKSAHIHRSQYIVMGLIYDSNPYLKQTNLHQNYLIMLLFESVNKTTLLGYTTNNDQIHKQEISVRLNFLPKLMLSLPTAIKTKKPPV